MQARLLDRDEQQRAGGQHHGDAHDAEAVAADGGEDHEHQRCQPADRAYRRGVEAEDLAGVALVGQPGQERARGGLRRADEEAQHQPEDPEDHRALADEQHGGDDDHRQQRAHDHRLRAHLVVEPAAGGRARGGDDVGGHPEDQHVAGGEPVDSDGEDRAVGEHARQPVAEDGGGDEEVRGVALVDPQPLQRRPQLAVGARPAQPLAGGRGSRGPQEQRQCGGEEPGGSEERDQADVQPAVGGQAEDPALPGDKEHEAQQQHHDPADVAERPADARVRPTVARVAIWLSIAK